ncbi:MAG: hypothetical protein GXD23_11850 [Comamonadaceae bacterium]|jgi:hypothetical protein|uniref:Uncharacterized protein n=1 Tax=Hydrogenophaga borbori TaxID=2294117 RepID=A0A372EJX1_9BURK|nr:MULTISPECIES: hypothetical protein [Hydrogenophaga]NCT98054.1 hypothetical protein [Comamonadaceae bacterium]RFP79159.1 hypothetical protein DY262_09225 [Hydrogenophaga borbori]WQB84170.1 hypothetical protein SOM08_02355 [Hydrogenophaga sp. SNF1]
MTEPPAPELLERLLNALSEELPADRPLALPRGEGPFLFDFEIASMPVTLLCDPRQAPASLTVACPLGPVPEGTALAEAALRQLLRVSQLTAGSGTVAGYEPGDRRLHLLHVVPLATASARLLVATMTGLAHMARRWREDHLLGAAPLADGLSAGLRA